MCFGYSILPWPDWIVFLGVKDHMHLRLVCCWCWYGTLSCIGVWSSQDPLSAAIFPVPFEFVGNFNCGELLNFDVAQRWWSLKELYIMTSRIALFLPPLHSAGEMLKAWLLPLTQIWND